MKPGILVISHGSRVGEWVSRVDEAVGAMRLEGTFASSETGTATKGSASDGDDWLIPVEAAFLELVPGRLIQDGIDRLEAEGVTDMLAIPLFVSSGSKHVSEIGWALGAYAEPAVETELTSMRVKASLTYGRPIDADPEIVTVLLDRSRRLLDGGDPAETAVLLIGHGSEHAGLHEAWASGLAALAAEVKEQGGYADAEIAMLRPDMARDAVGSLRSRRPGCEVLALPVFLSEGYFTQEVVTGRLSGLGCRYDGRTLMPHPLIAQWIARQAQDWLRSLA